ncbi:MAG TPA: pentapeptide repeat-containing protein [Acidobacteriaceae bacterium]|nr:pentapeptide repeat-containing protein [Acidobacteriaceae bacterium]
MLTQRIRPRPPSWAQTRARIRKRWLLPLVAFDWCWQWLAWALAHWSFLEVLEYLGSFSVLVGVIFWFAESGARVQQRHDAAWQVINTAQGKGGSGGRIEALQALNADHIALVGVDVSSAFLQGVRLRNARLARANFSAADVRDSNISDADLSWANLQTANFRNSTLENVDFSNADLSDADFVGADLRGSRLSSVDLENTDLRGANLSGVAWDHIANIRGANIAGVKAAPPGFVSWALAQGAIQKP